MAHVMFSASGPNLEVERAYSSAETRRAIDDPAGSTSLLCVSLARTLASAKPVLTSRFSSSRYELKTDRDNYPTLVFSSRDSSRAALSSLALCSCSWARGTNEG